MSQEKHFFDALWHLKQETLKKIYVSFEVGFFSFVFVYKNMMAQEQIV